MSLLRKGDACRRLPKPRSRTHRTVNNKEDGKGGEKEVRFKERGGRQGENQEEEEEATKERYEGRGS